MNDNWDTEYKNMWDERYRKEVYVYGKEPNDFFKEWLVKFKPGSILMPADGEGRNGVFAAKEGWAVTSYDLSGAGRAKALSLAHEYNVTINYIVEDFEALAFEKEKFDTIGLIYAHVAASKKLLFHQYINHALKPGGVVIFEAFSKKHLQFNKTNPKVGGPQDFDMLYSKDEILEAFTNYEILFLKEQEITLNEGIYHVGTCSVIRFVGKKN